MAGLGRNQQRFNAAVLGTLATLLSFARGDRQASERLKTHGHPILAKLIKSSNPNSNQRGYDYPGYCFGKQETERRRRQHWQRYWGTSSQEAA